MLLVWASLLTVPVMLRMLYIALDAMGTSHAHNTCETWWMASKARRGDGCIDGFKATCVRMCMFLPGSRMSVD